MSLLEAGSRKVLVTYPDETLHDAAARMLRNNIGRLPVVDRKNPQLVVGYLGRPGIMAARLHRLDDEHVREPGWVKRFPVSTSWNRQEPVPYLACKGTALALFCAAAISGRSACTETPSVPPEKPSM